MSVFYQLEWHDVRMPLVLSGWLLAIITARILFNQFHALSRVFPESALLIVLGLAVGYVFDHVWVLDIYLHPDLFFLYLLPPIALDAGYFLPNKAFFNNLWTILLYAVVGTLLNISLIGGCLYMFTEYYTVVMEPLQICLFATLISAVDPVAVLSVFEEIHVNQLLYICVFGESLLNDAVVIVLYHSLVSMTRIGSDELIHEDFATAAASFATVALGGVALGVVAVTVTALLTRWSHDLRVAQPLICVLIPYMFYLMAESVHLSGILSIVTCGLFMKFYIAGNLGDTELVTVKYFLKTISSNCEAIIFVFLGLSTFSKQHNWDWAFISVTVAACLIGRFLVVMVLTQLANTRRTNKIGIMDQLIMGYGGLRGAICYGLVMSLDDDIFPMRDMLMTTTVVVIIVTVFFQGTTISTLVSWLGVQRAEVAVDEQTLFMAKNAQHSMEMMKDGVEAILGHKGLRYYKRMISEWNEKFVEPTLMNRPTTTGTRMISKLSRLTIENQRKKLLENFGEQV